MERKFLLEKDRMMTLMPSQNDKTVPIASTAFSKNGNPGKAKPYSFHIEALIRHKPRKIPQPTAGIRQKESFFGEVPFFQSDLLPPAEDLPLFPAEANQTGAETVFR